MGYQEPRLVGTIIGKKYRVDAELGRGGMGAVYRVMHLQVHKEFALKILHERLTSNREAGVRFLKEAQAAGRIGHPAILDIYDVGEAEDGTQFMVMELLRGESLASVLEAGALTVDQASWVATELLDALAAAHRVGIVHRDVKPQNVFLANGPDGKRLVRLLDFGIAKFQETSEESALTRTGKIVGSPLYMAPEQARADDPVDARADVWSVGATLFEMLTGEVAHTGSSPIAVLARVLTEPAPKVSTRVAEIDPELDGIVERSLEINRDKRFASAAEMLDALLALREKLGLGATPPPTFAARRITPPPSEPPAAAKADRAPASSMTLSTRTTQDPLLNAAVTKSGPAAARRPPSPPWLVATLLLVGLGLTAAATFVMPGSHADERGAQSSPALPSITTPTARPAATLPALAGAVAPPRVETKASAPGTVTAEPTGLPAAKSSAPPVERAAHPGASRSACAPTEVLSSGHCCLRGFSWQKDRCERPLATSF